ncbi:HAD-IC family P-type ATPase [Streptomyces hainanensis]|uniref:HAD family hydrolase n=1 Tax=Streptomyces hainanensis TaxID=402648 RepID=A0A4R4TJX3_9ACTN|nr:HAD-IC family P-type ATPase [Streptomyces hainanensis]TDC76776.1 HAD family hydrolase [Streptomyces hainanensis]
MAQTDVEIEGPARGLTAAQVAERVGRGQVNDVPVRSSRSVGQIVRANVCTVFNAIMGTLFAIILVVGPIQDGMFGFIVLANALIGIVQELRAKHTLDSLAVVGGARPTVRRDGVAAEVPPDRIVLDDVLLLGPGDQVVVDGTVIEAEGLEIDESLLTGESDAVVKRHGDTVMSGSFVVAGGGSFVATRVGREAYAARLAEEASRFTLVDSELRNGISRILKICLILLVPAAIGLILGQLLGQDADTDEAIRRMVAGIVVMVPEGLVLMTSVAFAIGVVRLGRQRCLVQELPAIEGLARVDVVCLDKTGTLTEGGMDVAELRLLEAPDAAGDEAYVRRVLGTLGASDPRPNASLQAIAAAFPAPGGGWRATDTLPFSSARKYSAAALAEPEEPGAVWLLGAPDVLAPADHPRLAAVDELNARGLRVLLLARAQGSPGVAEPTVAAGAEPVALVVLEQRMRPEAPDTLRYFAEQGVAAKVISGDNAVSVGAVARRVGLDGGTAVDARGLPAEPDEFADAVAGGAVYGRVTPQQKREMVRALKSRGHTVAMTGDGVNDVLALKDADIGVAMGSGSPATRAVAQIVLLNNNFAALPTVVAEGRRVIGNIERVANLFLAKTVYSVFLAFAVILTAVPYPFLPRHMSLVSALTIGIPAFFLALAPNHERARPHFVRRVLRLALPFGLIAGAATFGVYLLARAHYGGTEASREAESSAATLTLFLIALWILVIVARPLTWWRTLLLGLMAAGFAVPLSVPWLQDFFELSLDGRQLPAVAVAVAVAAGVLLELVFRLAPRYVPDLPAES